MKPMKPAKALLVATVPVLAIAGGVLAGAGPAVAAPGPTPNGAIGAANMVNDHAFAGMMNAMGANNPNGDAGMFCAVYITNGVVAPGACAQP